jgi:hypothetical protein
MSKSASKDTDTLIKEIEDYVRESEHSAFKQGVVQGLEKGIHVGRLTALHGQLMMRFGRLPQETDRRVMVASADEIDEWLGNILVAPQLEDVFKIEEETPDEATDQEPPQKKKTSKSSVH